MSEISRNSTGLSGEYFVAAELYRRGWSVGMTIGNAKAVDIFAEKDNKRIAIQVKSIYKKKNVGFPIMKDRIRDDCYYILVNLNADIMASPDYYVLTSEEAKSKVKQYESRGIIDLSSLIKEPFLNNWAKLEGIKSEITSNDFQENKVSRQRLRRSRNMDEFIGLVMNAATEDFHNEKIHTDIRCFKRGCYGTIDIKVDYESGDLNWKCDKCVVGGTIVGWLKI